MIDLSDAKIMKLSKPEDEESPGNKGSIFFKQNLLIDFDGVNALKELFPLLKSCINV